MMDLISRQAAIDVLDKNHILGRGDLNEVLDHIVDRLEKLPSAQPKKRTEERTETHTCDYINRKDAIEAHYEYCNKHPDAGFPVWSLKILEDLPSAQPEQQWIPCSERLPEDVEIGEEYPTVIFCTKDNVYVGFYEYYLGGRWWDAEDYPVDNVIAWMPLPEPYRKDGESE